MNLDLLVGFRPLFILFDLWLLAMVALTYPMFRDYGDDQGDGMALVLLPRPELPRLRRTFSRFVITFVALVVLNQSLAGPHSPEALYESALTRVVDGVVVAPAQVAGYVDGFTSVSGS